MAPHLPLHGDRCHHRHHRCHLQPLQDQHCLCFFQMVKGNPPGFILGLQTDKLLFTLQNSLSRWLGFPRLWSGLGSALEPQIPMALAALLRVVEGRAERQPHGQGGSNLLNTGKRYWTVGMVGLGRVLLWNPCPGSTE